MVVEVRRSARIACKEVRFPPCPDTLLVNMDGKKAWQNSSLRQNSQLSGLRVPKGEISAPDTFYLLMAKSQSQNLAAEENAV